MSKKMEYLAWTLQVGLALVFLIAGSKKLLSEPSTVEIYAQIGFGQWFRYLTGVLEVIGGVTVLLRSIAALGGILLACLMVGATATHLFLIGGSPWLAIVLLGAALCLVWIRRLTLMETSGHWKRG